MNSDANTTYLVRHAQTAYSAHHVVNGALHVDIPLDDAGRAASRQYADADWLAGIASCRTSGFGRTLQTAQLLLPGARVPMTPDHRLNEVDYGSFEGGPWLTYGAWLVEAGWDAVPPGGTESWRGCVLRMLDGLLDCLALPGPRLVVGHGLLGSVARWLAGPHPPVGATTALPVFPEAPYLEPLVLGEEELRRLVAEGRRQFDRPADRSNAGRAVAR
ncbi:histidine phosphatase family protein [Streptomyces sp. NPDC056149]|uniref:histidine phosphatase family protein n=1 Tax=unclassified Streptomyces TaxID=2593676 RepID=UPI0023818B3B|nr:histidine phosphatase family protein [Streptomyces sp. WZ-12]